MSQAHKRPGPPGKAGAGERRKRKPLIFTRSDVTRAIRAHLDAGLSVARTEIGKDGRIIIVSGQPEPSGKPEQANVTTGDEWDRI